MNKSSTEAASSWKWNSYNS